MEKKQEAIRKAYGEHFEFFSQYINYDNGIAKVHSYVNRQNIKRELFSIWIDESIGGFYECFIPKSIVGISFNNKWISISKISDLPEQAIPVTGFSEQWKDEHNPNGTRECYYNGNPTIIQDVEWTSCKWSSDIDGYTSDTKTIPTHYKPIEQELLPIY